MSVTSERRATAAVDAPRRRRRWWPRLLVAVLVAALALPVALVGYVGVVARQDDRTPTDAIVVLGAAQYWNRPSPVLEARLAHAKQLYEANVADRVITVGGKQAGDRTTEAQAGRAWLVAQGLPPERVSAVAVGDDTLNSLTAVAKLMARRGWQSATLVTDPVHEARSLAMARALGMSAHTSPTQSGAGSSITLEGLGRESLGLAWFWLTERNSVPAVLP